MPALTPQIERSSLAIEIGGLRVRVGSSDSVFLTMLEKRYAGFLDGSGRAEFAFDVELIKPEILNHAIGDPQPDLRVTRNSSHWSIERGDFVAEWDLNSRKGRIRQSANPYNTDAVLRVLHSIVLVEEGGFLLHSASAIRNGKAFLFAGVSGAGKTTLSRLAPPDATLLTDEISYVRKQEGDYAAYGTPFTGELGKVGDNCSAPVAALYLLAQGLENRIDPVAAPDAGRELLANLLFFANDSEEVSCAFQAACDFVERVPVYRLTFFPDHRVWALIG